ncbi:MAG: adenylosuccinate lyase [Candidatus Altiarchaeales archaeon ex4484_43]|nr:MAG: adenylosuccinate lyase [Candidatus Altiarchaeales archaeon ex4484_43]RLI89924.1 MAG: adenylosuccinate lyase [Candidatus Altiarchaeales archaeon]
MSVHPIESRYGRPEVREIFDEEYRLQKMLDVEAALARAQGRVGDIPQSVADDISKKANIKYVKIQRVKEIEREIHHDVMAMVKALAEECGDSGRYVHLGATSNDITDTALALQLKKFLHFLLEDLEKLKSILIDLAKRHKHVVCIGRTHGQHSVPTTYGLKFAIWLCEVQRNIDRINECKKRILVGQMTGAVGTQAALGRNGMRIQRLVMKDLGLDPVLVSNQVIQRDRHSEFLLDLALIAESLNKIATEIRNLQRTEIAEVSEGFREKQVGSSTMPHKRNPIYAERICGLCRVIKANAIASLENIPLWHERDLTNSSCERIIIPESCILIDYILNLTIDLLKNLVFDYDKIEKNLNLSQGRIMAESVMMLLVEKGMGRQEAHELMRTCAIKSYEKRIPFRDVLVKNSKVLKYVTADELDSALNPERYTGTAVQQVDLVLRNLGYIHKI